MKYCVFILCLLASSANSALIKYDFEFATPDVGAGSLTVDTTQHALTAFDMSSPSINASWTGAAQISEPRHDGYHYWFLTADDFPLFRIEFSFYDGSVNDRFLENLLGHQGGEFPWLYNDEYIYPRFTQKTIIDTAQEVPEPATLALLGLGLVSFCRIKTRKA